MNKNSAVQISRDIKAKCHKVGVIPRNIFISVIDVIHGICVRNLKYKQNLARASSVKRRLMCTHSRTRNTPETAKETANSQSSNNLGKLWYESDQAWAEFDLPIKSVYRMNILDLLLTLTTSLRSNSEG